MKKNNKKGFTLVELVIVVAVMAILVAVAVPTIGSITKSAKKSVYMSNCRTIESIVKLADANNSNTNGTSVSVEGISIDNDAACEALNKATLGITNDLFYYHVATGVVNNQAATGSENVYIFGFDDDGKCTASADGLSCSYAEDFTENES